MKNIFITGISGYLGTRLIKTLKKRDDINDIVGIDVISPAANDDIRVTFYPKDIRDTNIESLLKEHRIDTLFHLAFVVRPIHNLKQMRDIDINGTQNILKSALAAGVKHLIAVSSTLAYGAHPDNSEELSEDDPLRGNKRFPYGYYKALTDNMIRQFHQSHPEMTVTILRPCTVFGPNIDNYVSRMMFLPITTTIKGYNPHVQFVHEDDFVDACLVAMEKNIPGAFNISGDGAITIADIANKLQTTVIPLPAWILYPLLEILWKAHFPRIEVNRGYLDYIRYPFIVSNQRAKKDLGFSPRYTSIQTLEDAMRFRKHS